MEIRQDGLSNALNGIGGIGDRTRHNLFTNPYMRDDGELTAIWLGGGVGRKICTSRPDDMVRTWIKFPTDTDGKMLKALDAIGARTHIRNMLYWTGLHRGALMVVGGLDNATDMSQPASLSKKSVAKWLKVYSASRVLNTASDLVADVSSPYYEDFDVFRLQRRFPMDGQSIIRVHASRCILSKGLPVPEDQNTSIDYKYIYWGMSRLQAVFDELSNSATVQTAFANLVSESTISTMTLESMASILANEDDAAARLQTTMDNIAKMKSFLNMVLLGPSDKLTRDQLSFSGWSETAMLFRQEVAASADSTIPRLYGIPSSGLGGGGSDEEAKKNYNDSIQADQETRLRPIVQKLVEWVAPSVNLPTDIPFEFNPLSTPTAKEEAETRKIHAETFKIYVDMASLDPMEVRDSVFGGDTYSSDIVLNPSLSEEDLNPEPPPPMIQAPNLPNLPMAPGAPKAPAKVPMPPIPPKGK